MDETAIGSLFQNTQKKNPCHCNRGSKHILLSGFIQQLCMSRIYPAASFSWFVKLSCSFSFSKSMHGLLSRHYQKNGALQLVLSACKNHFIGRCKNQGCPCTYVSNIKFLLQAADIRSFVYHILDSFYIQSAINPLNCSIAACIFRFHQEIIIT